MKRQIRDTYRRGAAIGSLLAAVSSLASAPSATAAAAASTDAANAVVAVVDTGINPYHETFRDDSPRARRHPSTYIPGYPKNATALRLTLNQSNYWKAVRADCARIWARIEPGRLYWFPGTKIVGAITFEPPEPLNCSEPEPMAWGRILDYDGHGTMTASRATSTEYGACRDCRVVAVQFPTAIPLVGAASSTDHAVAAIEWAASNAGWIDAQSNSWGPFLPVWEPTGQAGLITSNPKLVRAVEEVSSKHLAFWASGNGALFRFGVAGHPTPLAPHLAPSAIVVGGHDSGYVNTWPGFPAHVVSDSCNSWAAFPHEVDKSAENVGSGTSAATPFAAGGAIRILLEARRILGDDDTGVAKGVVARGPRGLVEAGPLADGELTLEEWKTVLFKTASPRPKGQFEDGPPCPTGLYGPTPVKWVDVPENYPEYLHIGYGAVDDAALKQAFGVLRGRLELPDRSSTDEYFANEGRVRGQLHEVFNKP